MPFKTIETFRLVDGDKIDNLPLDTTTELSNKVDKEAGKGLSTNDYTTAEKNKLATAEVTTNKGVVNGYAGLDGTGKVPASQLPSFVDDVLEYPDLASFPVTGETGIIYIALDTNKAYRWTGSTYVEIVGGVGVWKGAYSGATSYIVDDMVSYNGSSYRCTAPTTGNLPTDTLYWDLMASKGDTGATGATGPQGIQGDKGLNWQGTYSGVTAYVIDDAVEYNGSSYICILNSTGNLPTDTLYWDLLSQKGADGAGSGDFLADGSIPMTGDFDGGANNITNIDGIKINTAPVGAPSGAGSLSWNATDDTIDLDNGDGTTTQIGQEMHLKVRNITGVTLTNGTVVYINGADSGFPTVAKANANTTTTDSVIGLITADILTASNGKVTRQGKVRNINTSSFTAGDVLWLDTTDGLITNVRPQAPIHSVQIGYAITIDAVNGEIEVDIQHIPNANEILLEAIGGATYDTIQEMQDIYHSSGVGTWAGITDNGDGTIDVAGGSGYLRPTNDPLDTLLAVDWSASTGITMPTNTQTWIYVNYNSGTPTIQTTSIERSTDYNTNILLGVVYRNSTTQLHINPYLSYQIGDHAGLMIRRLQQIAPFARASGGTISATGTRNFAISAGSWWEGLNAFTTTAKDTSVADTFTYYYRDGLGGWTKVISQTQIDNLQYDDNSGTLATLGNSRYGVHWVYLEVDSGITVVYGRGSYLLTEAQDANAPGDLPPQIDNHGRLVGKIIIQKSSTTFESIQSAFDTTFDTASVSDHNSLTGLQGGTAGEYYHMTSAEYTKVGNAVVSDTTGVTGADQITNTMSLTQAEYDAITPNASTTYIITDAAAVATALKSATTDVDTSAATAPTSGQVLTATSSTTATWQTPAGGGWTELANVTLGSDSAQLDSGTFAASNVLRIQLCLKFSSSRPLIRINSDTSSNYENKWTEDISSTGSLGPASFWAISDNTSSGTRVIDLAVNNTSTLGLVFTGTAAIDGGTSGTVVSTIGKHNTIGQMTSMQIEAISGNVLSGSSVRIWGRD